MLFGGRGTPGNYPLLEIKEFEGKEIMAKIPSFSTSYYISGHHFTSASKYPFTAQHFSILFHGLTVSFRINRGQSRLSGSHSGIFARVRNYNAASRDQNSENRKGSRPKPVRPLRFPEPDREARGPNKERKTQTRRGFQAQTSAGC